MLSQKERDKILRQWGRGPTPEGPDPWVCDRIGEWVRRTPHAPAVEFENETVTYQDLEVRSNGLAYYLRGLGVGPEDRMGILLDRSPDAVAAILAVFKAGAAYIPMVPGYPAKRVAFMLADSKPKALISRRGLAERLPSHDARVILMDGEEAAAIGNKAFPTARRVTETNLAYVIYTSGTTGTPKGVMITHQGLNNLMRSQIRRFHVRPESRVLQFASFSFDASVSELAKTLCAGAALILASPRDNLINPLIRLGHEKRIDFARIMATTR